MEFFIAKELDGIGVGGAERGCFRLEEASSDNLYTDSHARIKSIPHANRSKSSHMKVVNKYDQHYPITSYVLIATEI